MSMSGNFVQKEKASQFGGVGVGAQKMSFGCHVVTRGDPPPSVH
jgi:hypothetical protein